MSLVSAAGAPVAKFHSTPIIFTYFLLQFQAAGYMRNVISKDLKDHFAEDVVVSECGNAELRHAYRKNGKVFELRFLFCKVEGGKTVIITYHGYPRCKPNESMQNDFIIFYQNLLRQRAK